MTHPKWNFSNEFALLMFETSLREPNFPDWNILDFDNLYVAVLGGYGPPVQKIALQLFPLLIAWAETDPKTSADKLKLIFDRLNYYRLVYPKLNRSEAQSIIDNILRFEMEQESDIWQSLFCELL